MRHAPDPRPQAAQSEPTPLAHHGPAEQEQPGQIRGGSAAQNPGVEAAQRFAAVRVSHDPLDAEGRKHDAGHDREVGVTVGVDRKPDPVTSLRPAQLVLSHQRGHVEVQPPQSQGDGDAQDRRGQQWCGDRAVDSSRAMARSDSPMVMIMNSSCRSAK